MDHAEDANEARIRAVWQQSAQPWVRAVREGAIQSRLRVTNDAIIDALLTELATRTDSARVLDLGCGEGWLLQALAQRGIAPARMVGVDGSAELLNAARSVTQAALYCSDYGQLPQLALGRFELIVANFSLLGATSTEQALHACAGLLAPSGCLLIQTLPPAQQEGWQAGSWQGCGEGFGEAAPWYARDLPAWTRALTAAGLALQAQRLTQDPTDGCARSLLLWCGLQP